MEQQNQRPSDIIIPSLLELGEEGNTSNYDNEAVVGFEAHAKATKEHLLGGEKCLDIFPIRGMPGIGKTTFAKKVYNDPDIQRHFYIRAWITDYQEFNRRNLLLRFLLRSPYANPSRYNAKSDEQLSEDLCKQLQGYRYFIVIDSIWENNEAAWDDFIRSLPDENNGSRIMVTTRSKEVAFGLRRHTYPCLLPFILSEEESWYMFQKKVFQERDCPPELMEVGMTIVQTCAQFPYAIHAVGGLLARIPKTQDCWHQIADQIMPNPFIPLTILPFTYLGMAVWHSIVQKTSDIISTPVLGLRTHNAEDGVVGFENEVTTIRERLVGKPMHLQVISIVGMPGIGKSTLAKKVYDDPYIAYHFHIRAWISISHTYQERNLLLGILSSPHIQPSGDLNNMSNEDLRETLYKRLKGIRYLIVLDDICNIQAWEGLKRSFPDDNNGSRIMFTTRDEGVALCAKPGSLTRKLRFLSEEESWNLFEQKVFQKEFCPGKLIKVGRKIVDKCRGLPLAIVVVGGLLAKEEKTELKWNQVAESLSSYITSDLGEFMKTLELSYTHLPEILKPCFLYFGIFPEDYEIPVTKLILLWMAEGFVEKGGNVTLEDAAEACLMDLVGRSLVTIASTSSNGVVKSCRIHDLLRDLCLKKAEEENFMQELNWYGEVTKESRRFFSSSALDRCPNVYTLFSYNKILKFDGFLELQNYESLRLFEFGHTCMDIFPIELSHLVYLRYFSLRVSFNKLLGSISFLQNLETLIVEGQGPIFVDHRIYELKKLRHLHINPSAFLDSESSGDNLVLDELQTLSTPIFNGENWLSLQSTPNLRKLKCILYECSFHPRFRGLEFLVKLEKLKMCERSTNYCDEWIDFPTSLKEITLSKFWFDWKEIRALARLPNLEVLKLRNSGFALKWRHIIVPWSTSFLGPNFQPFPKLKVLKFDNLNLAQWNASSDQLPSLQRLVFKSCHDLKEIPSDLGDILTLETIELNWCSQAAVESARRIHEEQQSVGNEKLQILVYPPEF